MSGPGNGVIRNVLLISSSKVHGYKYLEQPAPLIRNFLKESNTKSLLFIPYASNDYTAYTDKIKQAFRDLHLPIDVRGINEGDNPKKEIAAAEALFIGGGNTFLLLKTLYDLNLVEVIRDRVLKEGIPYIGISAGTNVATISINTTNDMPITYPPTFAALGLVPFNINPHYLDADPNDPHQGETRAQRIEEYLCQPECRPVLGLREGSAILVKNSSISLLGPKSAVLFQRNLLKPTECDTGADLSFLLDL